MNNTSLLNDDMNDYFITVFKKININLNLCCFQIHILFFKHANIF